MVGGKKVLKRKGSFAMFVILYCIRFIKKHFETMIHEVLFFLSTSMNVFSSIKLMADWVNTKSSI